MDHTDAIAWTLSACAAAVRYSQARTLRVLVQAALHRPRISLANLGPSMSGMVPCLLKNWPKRRLRPISFDWTGIRGIQTLVAAASVRGRAIPLAWASCEKHVYDGHRSRNAFEESLLWLRRGMTLPYVNAVGLGRPLVTAPVRQLQRQLPNWGWAIEMPPYGRWLSCGVANGKEAGQCGRRYRPHATEKVPGTVVPATLSERSFTRQHAPGRQWGREDSNLRRR